ncbi:phage tail tape measure protein [Rhodobacteraceae bacterium 63075]|nr:phage tail tape measure protein [Rhodobacteraceae bacterium 63075]
MSDFDKMDDMELKADALEQSLGAAASMAASFDAELKRVQQSFTETGQDVASLERGLSRGLRRAVDGVVMDGMKLSDVLGTVAQSMINASYSAAVKPVTDHFGGLIAQGIGGLMDNIFPFEKGASFSQGRVMPFASGGVVDGPVSFPMRGGTGLMGEAGPEAIMPLTRGSDGKLGVRAEASQPVSITMNISTPDVEGFRRSQSQIAAQMGRVLARGNRNR